MRIENGAGSIQPHEQYSPAPGTEGIQQSAVTRLNESTTSVDVTSVEGLLSLVSQSANVRETVVAGIRLKIQAGEYLTQQSATETARSILDL